ncbi:MAG: hypothetical protein M1346_02820 [Gammaproteobacteria bacterium]|jgi:hypothetical protein|nr:hypothetical protein [Gammaproteobacteria bacterium]
MQHPAVSSAHPSQGQPAAQSHLHRSAAPPVYQAAVQPKMSPPSANPRQSGSTIQPVIEIRADNYLGNFAGVYSGDDYGRLRSFLDGVGKALDNLYPNVPVKRGPLPLLRKKGTYTVADITELLDYMVSPEDHGLPMIFTKVYDGIHGNYHFNGKVTKKKAQWTISKEEAKQLMRDAIDQHMDVLTAGTPDEGWQAWYIAANANKVIGDTVEGSVPIFTIQLQVSKEFNRISYHGYPDQRVLGTGVGKTKKNLD